MDKLNMISRCVARTLLFDAKNYGGRSHSTFLLKEKNKYKEFANTYKEKQERGREGTGLRSRTKPL